MPAREVSTSSEHHAETEPELALVYPFASEILHLGDGHEVLAVTDVVVRIRQVGCVREVERLHPELQSHPGSNGELACQPEVPVEETRPAQVVIPGVAEARLGYLGKRCRIVVRRAPADSAELLHVRLHLVRRLVAAR